MNRKKQKLALAAALTVGLATGAAHAGDNPDNGWQPDCRHGWIIKEFASDPSDLSPPPVSVAGPFARISYGELRQLLKDIPRITREIRACEAYRKCTADRYAGKVKHCYENDPRWREFFGNDW
jgi:hypothetical protein